MVGPAELFDNGFGEGVRGQVFSWWKLPPKNNETS